MKAVERVSNWGFWDTLDGRELVDGERLIVQWPDGSQTVHVCGVQKGTLHYSDHGHPGTGPDNRAYIEAPIRGATVRVYLADSGLLCERQANVWPTAGQTTIQCG